MLCNECMNSDERGPIQGGFIPDGFTPNPPLPPYQPPPKYTSEKCPRCNGIGRVSDGGLGSQECYRCKGWGALVLDQRTGQFVEQEEQEDRDE